MDENGVAAVPSSCCPASTCPSMFSKSPGLWLTPHCATSHAHGAQVPPERHSVADACRLLPGDRSRKAFPPHRAQLQNQSSSK